VKYEWVPIIIRIVTSQNSGGSSITAWLPVIVGLITATATLCGVVIGGVVTYFIKRVELSHQIAEENRKLKIARLEELHERILDFISISGQMVSGYIDMKSRRSTSRKELGDILAPSSAAIGKVSSLLKIYAGDLEGDLNKLIIAYEILLSKCTEYMTTSTVASTDLVNFHGEVSTYCRELEKKVRAKVQEQILT
jgi:hypothetical protein